VLVAASTWVSDLTDDEKEELGGAWLWSTEEFNNRIIDKEPLYRVF